ncbi:MAG: 30S ribosome-binding factor RbfA [Clostridia bacterium]|nr:30S ribosome-binding factor RbfA [Clostridia bacterium]
MASFDRIDRISQEVRHALDRIIRDSVKDPRVRGTWSVTRAEVTRDLKICKVRVSVLEDEYRSDLLKALKNASGFIRRELGREVDLRNTPQLIFEDDRNMEYAQHIGQILSEESKKLSDRPEEE